MVLYICFSYFNEALHQDRNSFNISSDTAILLMGALTAGYCENCRISFEWEMKNRLILKSVRQNYAFLWVFCCREKDNNSMQ